MKIACKGEQIGCFVNDTLVHETILPGIPSLVSTAALDKEAHTIILKVIKVVFLGHIIGGWPSNWNDGSVKLRKADSDKFVKITPEMLVH